jgi:hypothetical protein
LLDALVLCCAGAQAGICHRPSSYPSKDVPPLPLTDAYRIWGEQPTSGPPFPSGWDRPKGHPAAEGVDLHYDIPEHEEGWFICEYRSRKRIEGKFRNGHEYGQQMEQFGEELWFIKLAPNDTTCMIGIREVKIAS